MGQCADILLFRPALVPVGEDQLAHIEMCREVARRFNHTYCGVDPATADGDHVTAGGVFPIPEGLVGRVGRLVGVDGVQKIGPGRKVTPVPWIDSANAASAPKAVPSSTSNVTPVAVNAASAANR